MRRIALLLIALASTLGFTATANAHYVRCQVGGYYYSTYPCKQRLVRHDRRRIYYESRIHRHRELIRHYRRNSCGTCNGPASNYRAPVGPVATPRNETYRPALIAEVRNGIKYTGKACTRADGSMGAEGYGLHGELGCWKF